MAIKTSHHEPLNITIDDIDYKNYQMLRKVTSNYAKILPAKRTNMTAKMQRKVSREIKRARFMALLPYVRK